MDEFNNTYDDQFFEMEGNPDQKGYQNEPEVPVTDEEDDDNSNPF